MITNVKVSGNGALDLSTGGKWLCIDTYDCWLNYAQDFEYTLGLWCPFTWGANSWDGRVSPTMSLAETANLLEQS